MQTLMSISELSPEPDLVKIVSAYLALQESRKVLKGTCPFHADGGSSLMVYASRNRFKCFGCGIEGGPAEFMVAVERSGGLTKPLQHLESA
jgi:DNA primase